MEKTASRFTPAAIFAVVFLLNALLMPAEFLRGDPMVWFREAQSIVYRGELALEEGAIPYGQPGQYVVQNERNGKTYSKYGLMSSITVIPAVLGGALLDESETVPVIATNLWYALGSAALALLLFQLAGRYVASVRARLLFVAGCLYCSFLWFYLRAQSMELFICIYALLWYRALVELGEARAEAGSPGYRRRVVVAWLMVLFLVHTRPMFILLAGLTTVWIGWELWRQRRPGWGMRIALGGVLPLVVVAASLAVANAVRFGAWYHTGYHQWNPQEHTASLANLPNLFGFLADPHYSVLLTFPPLLLSLFAAGRFWQRHRRDYLLALILLIGALLFYSLFPNWRGEWSAGPRYVLFALLPASLPCALLLAGLMDEAPAWGRRLRLAAVCLLLAASCFCWYQVIARRMFAWQAATEGLSDYMSVESARICLIQPRGLLLRSLDRPLEEFATHPLMVQAKKMMPTQQYKDYRKSVYLEVQARNFYLLRSLQNPQ